jgi:ARID/BRIGHT DNA binding domain
MLVPHPRPALTRAAFLAAYSQLCAAKGLPFTESLLVRRLTVDAHALFQAVRDQGGFNAVNAKKLWAATARRFGHPE